MQNTIIKIAAVVIVVSLTIIYIKYLQNENDKLTSKVSILTAINESNALELSRLQYAVKVNDATVMEWEINKQEIEAIKNSNTTKLQKELQTNENFSEWASMPVPADVNSMLNISTRTD